MKIEDLRSNTIYENLGLSLNSPTRGPTTPASATVKFDRSKSPALSPTFKLKKIKSESPRTARTPKIQSAILDDRADFGSGGGYLRGRSIQEEDEVLSVRFGGGGGDDDGAS